MNYVIDYILGYITGARCFIGSTESTLNNVHDSQALLELEPPSGRVFPHALWWRSMGGRMVMPPHREPMLLSYLLPLSRHASSQTPTDPKASAFPVSPIPHPNYAHHVTPNTIPLAIPTQPLIIIHPCWPFSRLAGLNPARAS